MINKDWTIVDLFCGAGGLSEGFRQAGCHVLVGNDYDAAAGETFRATHSEAKFLPGAIQHHSSEDFLKAAGLKRGGLDCLVGGPPCQGFSVNNHQRGMHDERSNLYQEYLRVVEGLNPKWVVLENVTGITSTGGGVAVVEIISGLQRLGYHVEKRILKAEEYGIPQARRRVVFIGNRLGIPMSWPDASHGPGLSPFVTVRDAIGDLPILGNGGDCDGASYGTKPTCDFQLALRGNLNIVSNHSAPKLSEVNLERMKHIPAGGSWRDIPVDLLPAGMKLAKRSDHTKRYGRLRWEGLSSTILTKCDLHWGAYIHPVQNRSLSVREAARFQAFPDWFEFKGSRTEQYVQVGNAVPPILGRKIAEAILMASEKASNSTATNSGQAFNARFIAVS